MKQVLNLKRIRALALVLGALVVGPVQAEQQAAKPQPTVVAEQAQSDVSSGALSAASAANSSAEPFYAGTSTWFLLSIAALGSIAVQRRGGEATD